MLTHRVAFALVAVSLLMAGAPSARPLPLVHPNDNRLPAGTLRHDTLTLRLVVTMARWYPERPGGPFVDVPVFAEEGRAPQVPAPLIRVPTRTVLRVSLRNALPDSTLQVVGLARHPLDSLAPEPVPAGATRTFVFEAGAPGTYIYSATPGKVNPDSTEQQQLAGALVVDSAATHAPDRVFVMNIWSQVDTSALGGHNVLAINGRTWPWTERLETWVGDTVQWRFLNATVRGHPMHMHGFYFRLDAKGGPGADTAFAPDRREWLVTQQMLPFSTMHITWAAPNPGNWLFHCHLAFHIAPENALEWPTHPGEMANHMVGLVLGIAARSRVTASLPPARDSAVVYVDEGPQRGHAPRTREYVVGSGGRVPAPDSLPNTSEILVLTRGVPSIVTVVNRLREATAVHWHGLELDDSYSDGVAGWSGAGSHLAPEIPAGKSFTARLLAPRAGTFIYHAHLDDIEQLSSGLYAPMIVLEPGTHLDPATDHAFIAGWDSPHGSPSVPPYLLINGDSVSSPPIRTVQGRAQRLRFINMGLAGMVTYTLWRDSTPVTWRALAKDGADLPASLATTMPAHTMVAVGETRDFTFAPTDTGSYRLTAGPVGLPPTWSQAIIVQQRPGNSTVSSPNAPSGP
jgi:FtsP/CotA-like multicopper oxidase with cupredoxin domain